MEWKTTLKNLILDQMQLIYYSLTITIIRVWAEAMTCREGHFFSFQWIKIKLFNRLKYADACAQIDQVIFSFTLQSCHKVATLGLHPVVTEGVPRAKRPAPAEVFCLFSAM